MGIVKIFDFGLAKELSDRDKADNGLYKLTGFTGKYTVLLTLGTEDDAIISGPSKVLILDIFNPRTQVPSGTWPPRLDYDTRTIRRLIIVSPHQRCNHLYWSLLGL